MQTCEMEKGRPRKYASNADRQAAYRQRQRSAVVEARALELRRTAPHVLTPAETLREAQKNLNHALWCWSNALGGEMDWSTFESRNAAWRAWRASRCVTAGGDGFCNTNCPGARLREERHERD